MFDPQAFKKINCKTDRYKKLDNPHVEDVQELQVEY